MERPEDRDKAQVTLALNAVFRVIMGLLSQKANIEIDMGILGKLAIFDKTVTHEPHSILKRTLMEGSKTAVSMLMAGKENTTRLAKK